MIDLKSVLASHPDCLSSKASLKSVLMDIYPSEKTMVNILTILFECGVADKIKATKNIDSNEMQRLIAQIENEYCISGQYSQDAILVWAAAFDVAVSSGKTNTAAVAPSEVSNPVVYVQSSADDYEVVQKTDGYYITRFKGVEEENVTVPSLIDGKKIKGIGISAFEGCSKIKRIRICEGIEEVLNSAFHDCTSLEAVDLPDTLQRIGRRIGYTFGAFEGTNLKAVVIPQNVEYVSGSSFTACANLQKVVMSNKIDTIREFTFAGCKSLSEIELPSSLVKIETHAFFGCSALREIRIPHGTQEICAAAFECTDLSSIYIPATVTRISNSAFGSDAGNLTIYCAAGSVAMDYAKKNNLKYEEAQF